MSLISGVTRRYTGSSTNSVMWNVATHIRCMVAHHLLHGSPKHTHARTQTHSGCVSLHVQLADMCGASCVRGQGCMPLSQLGNGCPVCCAHTHTHTHTHRHTSTHRQWRGSAQPSCPPKDEFLLCLGKRM